MALAALDVLDQARDYHPSFDRRTVPDKAALRYLSRYQRRLAERIMAVSEDALLVRASFDAGDVATAIADGTPLLLDSDPLLIVDVTTDLGQGFVPVSIVSYVNRQLGYDRFPTAYVMGRSLYLTDLRNFPGPLDSLPLVTGWETATGLTITYVPLPASVTPTGDAATLTLPDACEDALVANLALWMAQRTGALKELPTLRDEAEGAEQTAITAMSDADRGGTWVVQEVV